MIKYIFFAIKAHCKILLHIKKSINLILFVLFSVIFELSDFDSFLFVENYRNCHHTSCRALCVASGGDGRFREKKKYCKRVEIKWNDSMRWQPSKNQVELWKSFKLWALLREQTDFLVELRKVFPEDITFLDIWRGF